MSQMIQITTTGDKALMRELATAATAALPTPVVKEIFKRALQPMFMTAKKMARRIPNKPTEKFKSGKYKKPKFSKLGRQLSMSLALRKYKSRRHPGAWIGISKKKLAKFSNYKHHGRAGVPLAQMMEKGTDNRKTRKGRDRGRLIGKEPIWKAFQIHKRQAIAISTKKLVVSMSRNNRRFQYLHFTQNGFGI